MRGADEGMRLIVANGAHRWWWVVKEAEGRDTGGEGVGEVTCRLIQSYREEGEDGGRELF